MSQISSPSLWLFAWCCHRCFNAVKFINLLHYCLCFWSILKKSVFNPVLYYWMFRFFWLFSISDNAVLNILYISLFICVRFSQSHVSMWVRLLCQTIPVSFYSAFTVAGIHSMVSITVISWVPYNWLLASRMCRSDIWFFQSWLMKTSHLGILQCSCLFPCFLVIQWST